MLKIIIIISVLCFLALFLGLIFVFKKIYRALEILVSVAYSRGLSY